jgi:hypothetical protein
MHVRARLTLWYLLVFAALLLFACAGTGCLLFWQMRGQLTHYAIQDIETIEGLLSFTLAGTITMREDFQNEAAEGSGSVNGQPARAVEVWYLEEGIREIELSGNLTP